MKTTQTSSSAEKDGGKRKALNDLKNGKKTKKNKKSSGIPRISKAEKEQLYERCRADMEQIKVCLKSD